MDVGQAQEFLHNQTVALTSLLAHVVGRDGIVVVGAILDVRNATKTS